jgi:microcystin-dependent protein
MLAMPELFATAGLFPTRNGGAAPAYFNMGMIQIFAGTSPAFGAPRAEGQILQVMTNQALFSLIGINFGGDPLRDFALPNLNGRIAVGATQVIGQEGQESLTLMYLVAPFASATAPVAGMVALFAANWAPDGWVPADGSMLAISQNVALFEIIGATFGGNGESDFMLPDLQGAAAVGVGQGSGLPEVALGQKTGGLIPGLGLNYVISLTGPVPPAGGNGAFPETGPFLGQVIAYAGAQAPAGWAPCDGSLFEVQTNQALFELIGTTYGGDGKTNFALPDLRGRMIVGQSG